MKMKRKITILLFLVGAGVTALNLNWSNISKPDINLTSLGLLAVANAENDECRTPEWIYGTCNHRTESIYLICYVTTITRTYTNSYGKVVGVGTVVGGTVTMLWGYQTGTYTESTATSTFPATRVNCPTDGNGNTCETYDPCF